MPVWHGEARVKNCERMVAVATAIPSGKSASADGMKWDLYPQNLMSEYHIRYGGYGGIGYYLVADSYMGLHKGRCDKTQQYVRAVLAEFAPLGGARCSFGIKLRLKGG